MKKSTNIVLWLAAIFVILLLGLLLRLETYASGWVKTENKQLRTDLEAAGFNEIYLTNEANHLAQFHTFRNALKDIDIIDYNRETNNCYDQSQALQAKLREMGIESTIAVVEGREHAFLMPWVEATTGDFISPEIGYKLIEFRSEKHNVICNNE